MAITADDLRDWTQGLVLVASDDDLAPHMQIVSALAGSELVVDVIGLVGYAFGLVTEEDSQGQRIAEVCRATVADWQAGEKLERVLAGAALVTMLNDAKPAVRAVVALAGDAAAFVGAKPSVPRLSELIPAKLESVADEVRAHTPQLPGLRVLLDKAIGNPVPDDDGDVTNAELRAALAPLRDGARKTADALDAFLRAVVQLHRRTSEEIDLLWWSLEPFSRDIPRAWSEIKDVTLVTGVEIFRRLSSDPPPRGAAGIAKHALSKAGIDPTSRATVQDLVNGLSVDVISELSVGSLGWVTPVLDAIGNESAAVAAPHIEWVIQLVQDLSLKRMAGQ